MFPKIVLFLVCINCITFSQEELQPLINPANPKVLIANVGPLSGISRDPDKMQFFLYRSSNPDRKEVIYNDRASLENSGYDSKVRTVIAMDGFLSTSKDPMSLIYGKGYPEFYKNEVNLIVVEYGDLSGATAARHWGCLFAIANYPVVVNNSPIMAKRLAEFVTFLGTEPTLVHLIGHSLGAHICGMAANILKSEGFTIYRVTGLDPAGPLFTGKDSAQRLSPECAGFVDAYYTNMCELGTTVANNGHANVIVNGGCKQPGCNLLHNALVANSPGEHLPGYCSHTYSWKFFIASILSAFDGSSCNASFYPLSSCYPKYSLSTQTKELRVGEFLPYGTIGDYYVYTKEPLSNNY